MFDGTYLLMKKYIVLCFTDLTWVFHFHDQSSDLDEIEEYIKRNDQVWNYAAEYLQER